MSSNKELLEKLIEDQEKFKQEVRKELSLLREDVDNMSLHLDSLEEQAVLTNKNYKREIEGLKGEVQWMSDKLKAAVETKVEAIGDMLETKRVKPRKKIWWQIWKR